MKRLLLIALMFYTAGAMAQSMTSNAGASSTASSSTSAGSTSSSGMMTSQMGNITFQNTPANSHQTLDTTPNVYIAPSMFGGANNCGQSNTLGVGVTAFGIGGSLASESKSCNTRSDTATAYKLGYKEVADMRFFCFGEKPNREAWEATGHTCPNDKVASNSASPSTSTTPKDGSAVPSKVSYAAPARGRALTPSSGVTIASSGFSSDDVAVNEDQVPKRYAFSSYVEH
ncbi:hypothetical protein [Candidimonas nitroreducens]|nr:hypothetical protein [Candidimonas nitroreducens]